MPTRIHLAPDGPSAPSDAARRFNFNLPLAIGAALVLWAAILIGVRLLTV